MLGSEAGRSAQGITMLKAWGQNCRLMASSKRVSASR